MINLYNSTAFVLIMSVMFIFCGCKVSKYLRVVDGSKADGTLTMAYEYGSFEKPQVKWEQAQKEAIERCRAWGYSDARFFDSGMEECISLGEFGCNRWRVTYTCQCVD